MVAPFLESVVFRESVVDDDGAGTGLDDSGGEADAIDRNDADAASDFDPDDFPDWYQDKVAPAQAPDNEPVAPDTERPYFFDLAVVKTLDRLTFGPITILAGDNGSGKSTLIEAIAVAAGFNAEGGSRNLMFTTYDTHSALADHLTLRWVSRPKWGWFLRSETFYGMATHITKDDDPYGGVAAIFPDLHNKSHGESFLALAESRFTGKGLYIFDEPEAALSIQGQMRLVAIINESVKQGSQFIISTHSPFLMGIPGATVVETSAEEGIVPTSFDQLESTALWQRFFADPATVHDQLL